MNTPSPQPLDPKNLLQEALHDTDRPKPWTAPALDEVAARFPELAIEEQIGQGGMAAVYRAVQKKLDRRVALKVLRPDLAKEPEFVARFLREAKALAQLSHPHVLAVHDFGERDGLCYLLVEYVDGANLRELMALGRLSPLEALRIVPQICSGLQFAHEHGIVHRDVKPENVLVDRQGRVVLADFGLAKLAGGDSQPNLTRSSMVFGTPHYMAPEQWRGSGAVDHRADIYSLGVVLYELLTGKLPVGTYDPPSRSKGVPGGIDQVVHRSLEHEPERRYQSARDVQRDVEREAQGAAAGAAAKPRAAVPVGEAHTLAARGWRRLTAAVVVLVGMTLALVAFLDLQDRRWYAPELRAMEAKHNTALLEQIRTKVHAGEAWTGELPKVNPHNSYPMLDASVRYPLVAGWSLGTVVLFAVLLLAAMRHARACGDRRLLLATAIVGAAPFVAAADAWLAEMAGAGRHGNELATVAVIALIVAINGALLRGLWKWTRGASVRALPNARGGVATAAIAAFAIVGCGGAAWWLHATTPPVQQAVINLPTVATDLLGKSCAEVIDRFGPPVAIQAAPISMNWGYYGADGALLTDALMIQNGHVVAVNSSHVLLVPEVRPESAPYPGMAIEGLQRLLGSPTATTQGPVNDEFAYADGTRVMVMHGIVIGITPK